LNFGLSHFFKSLSLFLPASLQLTASRTVGTNEKQRKIPWKLYFDHVACSFVLQLLWLGTTFQARRSGPHNWSILILPWHSHFTFSRCLDLKNQLLPTRLEHANKTRLRDQIYSWTKHTKKSVNCILINYFFIFLTLFEWKSRNSNIKKIKKIQNYFFFNFHTQKVC